METDVNQTWKQFLRFVKERDYHAITKNAIPLLLDKAKYVVPNNKKKCLELIFFFLLLLKILKLI